MQICIKLNESNAIEVIMTLKEKILFMISCGYTQQKIGEKTGISQSSISRISMGIQQSLQYEKGEALNKLYQEVVGGLCLKN
jgi:uncharacterized protein YerC